MKNRTNLKPLLAVFAFFLMVGTAVAWFDDVEIVPPNPTSHDTIYITLSGYWNNACVPYDSAISVEGNNIYFDAIADYPPDIFCAAVMTPWQLPESVGPLPVGTYTVYAYLIPDFPSYEPVAEFTVTATTYYVDVVNGNDNNDGLTPETAFKTIQKGINEAFDGDNVIVLPGVYTGTGNKNLDFGGKAITVRSTEPNDPNVVAATVINCQSSGRGFNFHSGEGPNSVVCGFTITSGYVSYNKNGGGIYCSGSSPTIKNCIITNNKAQGAMAYGPPYNNDGGDACGGAIYCTSNSNPAIINCIISNNKAVGGDGYSGWACGSGGSGNGGAICSTSNSNPTIENCSIIGNIVSGGNGGMDVMFGDGGDGGFAYGAAICCGMGCTMNIINCTISNNDASGGNGGQGGCGPDGPPCGWPGAGGNAYGGAVDCNFDSELVIENCTISENTASGGKGGDSSSTWPAFNGGNAYGGAVYCDYSSELMVENCTISDNAASGGDGGDGLPPFSYGGNGGNGYGGFVYYNRTVQSTLQNCTIVGNTASGGNGGEFTGSPGHGYARILYSIDSTTTITNSIIWDSVFHGPQILLGSSESFSVITSYFNDIQGGTSQILPIGTCFFIWDSSNIDVDPCFVDMSDGDYHLQSESGRWEPASQTWVTDANTSPCIDAGNPNSDWTAELWPHGKRINMGAYGGTPQASMSLSDVGNIADLDNDDDVDYTDTMLLTDKWLNQQVLLSEDLDRNGSVDAFDFSIFAENWCWR